MATTNPLSSGLRSSEGRLAIISVLLLVAEWLLPQLTDYQASNPSQRWVALAIAVVSLGYSIGRSYVKGKAIEATTAPMSNVPLAPSSTLTPPPQ